MSAIIGDDGKSIGVQKLVCRFYYRIKNVEYVELRTRRMEAKNSSNGIFISFLKYNPIFFFLTLFNTSSIKTLVNKDYIQ